ncbi:MAG: alpha-amylase/4-alpha-glucanotransferase domain-containing protein, partial [Planctomycetota bacterium]|nr:alpha-amylase/4-alpha-glucanotransferase domain-containing protein [Planctomycetota bacterium]
MTPTIRLCLVLHNHQPVGNFDHVFEQAYEDSYRPFLDVFEPYDSLNLSLHTSGPLIEWLAERHPEYLDRLAALVAAGRVEIIGGAFYEPILTMIPSRDRIGQITSFSRWLEDRLGGEVRGMWIPERVWEQSLAGDLAKSEIQYTLLDDFHFKNAGLDAEALTGHFVTEDDGRTVNVFPGSEPLRYLIPFRPPHETIDFLRQQAEQHPGSVAVFGDDGEKFGTWPDTKAHVYDDGWLREFFDALTAEKDWLKTTTLADAYRETDSVGKIYIPDGSYREMTEWALPVPQQLKYDSIIHELETHEKFEQIKRFMKGGFWRNFKTKYPESGEMYARMMHVSSLLLQAEQ